MLGKLGPVSVLARTLDDGAAGPDAFLADAQQYRRELLAHCYRMTGSLHDAEDLVQETFLRAWKAYDRFEGKSSVRTWLHRIATNTCLTALEGRSARPLPTGLGAPSSDPSDDMLERTEVPWLEPLPDGGEDPADPSVIVGSRESVRLAFIAALQHLPPRQRAVLVLRDVLQWKAAEVADAIGTTTAAVNSLLQRARAQLDEVGPSQDDQFAAPQDREARDLLARYIAAFEDYDIDALVTMFTADAIWEMPPFTAWYQGPGPSARSPANCPAENPGDMRLMPTAANGQPAAAMYMLDPETGRHVPFQLHVLDVSPAGSRMSSRSWTLAVREIRAAGESVGARRSLPVAEVPEDEQAGPHCADPQRRDNAVEREPGAHGAEQRSEAPVVPLSEPTLVRVAEHRRATADDRRDGEEILVVWRHHLWRLPVTVKLNCYA